MWRSASVAERRPQNPGHLRNAARAVPVGRIGLDRPPPPAANDNRRSLADRLKGKLAFCTASSAGIGWATAIAFAREGARVIASDVMTMVTMPGAFVSCTVGGVR